LVDDPNEEGVEARLKKHTTGGKNRHGGDRKGVKTGCQKKTLRKY